jgi:tetratricopeptide (TPR) repeat protein
MPIEYSLHKTLLRRGALASALVFILTCCADANPQAQAHYKKGLQLSLQKKWSQAEAEYRRAIALDPKNAEYHSSLADALAAQGKFEQAQNTYKQSDQIEKTNPQPRYKKPAPHRVGSTPHAKPKPKTPVAKSSSKSPRSPTTGTARGNTSTKTRIPNFPLPPVGDDGEGVKDGERVVTRSDGDTIIVLPGDDFMEADSNFERGLELEQQAKWPQAEAAFRAATKATSRNAEAWRALGDVQFKQGKWQGAETSHRAAVRLRPEEGWYRAQLAADLLKQGRRDEAAEEARAAIRLGVADHEVFDELGLHVNATQGD